MENQNITKNDFDIWNEMKKSLDANSISIHVSRGDIWWTSIGKNIGREEDGKGEYFERPVVVLSKYSHETFLALPLTRQSGNTPYRLKVTDWEGAPTYAILSQPRILDTKRALRLICKISKPIYEELVEKFKDTL